MRTFLHVLFIILSCAAGILGFVQAAVAAYGEKEAKDRFIDWYFYVDEGGLRRIVSSSATLLDSVLDRVLGAKILSLRALLTWIVPVALFFVLVFYAYYAPRIGETLTVSEWALLTLATGIGVSLLDFPALCISRLLFRKIAAGRTTLWTTLYVVVAYLAIGAPFLLTLLNEDGSERGGYHWYAWFVWPWLYVQPAFAHHVALPLMFVLACSSVLLFPVILIALLVYTLRPIMQPFVLRVIDRMERSKTGVFPLTTAALSAIVGMLALLPEIK